MPQSCPSAAKVRGTGRTLVVALALALGVLGAVKWASADAPPVGEAQLEGLEFFEVASCDLADREAC